MTDKFPIESDFIDSFLNYFIISNKNKDFNVSKQSLIFAKCVNLNNQTLRIGDCSRARELTYQFLESNDLNAPKEQILSECSKQVSLAHSNFFVSLNGQYTNFSSQVNNDLLDCIKRINSSLF